MQDEHLEEQVRSLLAERRKLEAVKLYKKRTGASLAEAKSAVEMMAAGEEPAPQRSGAELENDVRSLLARGEKLRAVKLYKDETGCSLREAKRIVESIVGHGSSAVVETSGSSRLLLVAVFLVLAAGVAVSVVFLLFVS